MVIKYPNFNKFPFFLTTTDTDNNLLIDLVDRAKTAETADSVNWSGVNIDADKDMGGYSLSNITSITAVNAYIANLMQDLNMNNFSISGVNTLTTTRINTKTVTPGYVIQQTGGSYSDSTSHSFADGTGGIIYSTNITKPDIDSNNYSKIIIEVDAYVNTGNKLLIVKLLDSNGNQIRSGYEDVRNTTTQTKKFEFILEDPTINKYTIKVITQPVFDSGTLTTTGFRVYW